MTPQLWTATAAGFLALSATAFAQTPAAPNKVCDLMSREEMQLCLRTQPGDASGARSSRCDQVPRSTIESCLQESAASDGSIVAQSASAGSTKPPEPTRASGRGS